MYTGMCLCLQPFIVHRWSSKGLFSPTLLVFSMLSRYFLVYFYMTRSYIRYTLDEILENLAISLPLYIIFYISAYSSRPSCLQADGSRGTPCADYSVDVVYQSVSDEKLSLMCAHTEDYIRKCIFQKPLELH